MSEIFNVKTIINKLKQILKCGKCNNLFDFSVHLPLITITGETYCKQCLLDNNILIKDKNKLIINSYEENLFPNKFIVNLKIKVIIEEILNLYDNLINKKYADLPNHLNERNNNNQRYGHYLITYNNSAKIIKECNSNENIFNNSNKKLNFKKNNLLNSTKNIYEKNIFFINNLNDSNGKAKNNNNNIENNNNNNHKIISKNIILKNTENNNNKYKNEKISDFKISNNEDNLNTFKINEEININLDKENNIFEIKDINAMKNICDDSIETIPFNEEKSTVNISFKNEFDDFWSKNEELKCETNIQKELNNEFSKNIFINKKNFIYRNINKIYGSSSNITKKDNMNMNDKDKKKVKEYNLVHQLSEPNFEKIKNNKIQINSNLNSPEKKKINSQIKEEEKSLNNKIDEILIKRIYKNSNYYEVGNKQIFKSMTNYNNKNEISPNDFKKIDGYNNYNFHKITPRQIISKEIKRKIEEDEMDESDKRYKNLTSIKDNNICNNINKFEDKNILFDKNEIKIISKKIKNEYNNEEGNKKSLLTSYNFEKSKYYLNNSKINHNITYNRKILGKKSLSPHKNNQNNSDIKNLFNKTEYFKKVNNFKNNILKCSVISNSKANDNIINIDNNISIIENFNSRDNIQVPNINNTNKNNNINKTTSNYFKIDRKRKHLINIKNRISNFNHNDISNNGNNINSNEGSIQNGKKVINEKIISLKKSKASTSNSKDKLSNLKVGNNLIIKINKKQNKNLSINNYLEIKNKEFNILFDDKIKKEKNIEIKNSLLTNKTKYLEIIQNSTNCSLFNNSLNDIQILFLQNNDFFIGTLSSNDNLPQEGILYSLDGNYYEGTFLNGKKEGKGIILYKNGLKYEGEIKNNLHNGFGRLIKSEKEVFIGEWKDGKMNGKGIRYHSNGDTYSGEYLNNIREGVGKYTFFNGDSYEGNWKNGKANGKGIFKFSNGDIYEGYFENNNFCGQNSFINKNSELRNIEFKNRLFNREQIISNKKKEKYFANFLKGKNNRNRELYEQSGSSIKSKIFNSTEFIC